MTTPRDVAVLVGSLRQGSLNLRMAKALAGLAPDGLKLGIVPIGDLPLYNSDLDNDTPPAPWTQFRQRMARAEAVLFVTPEYNRSLPAALKNALDVGSRPNGESVWTGKPGAVVSVSPGAYGGFGANHHLRQAMVFLDVPMLQRPEAYIGGADKLFSDAGELVDERTRKYMATFMKAYAVWVEKLLG